MSEKEGQIIKNQMIHNIQNSIYGASGVDVDCMENKDKFMSDIQKVYNASGENNELKRAADKAEQLSKMSAKERFVDNLCDVFFNNHVMGIKTRCGKNSTPDDVFMKVVINGIEEDISLHDIYDNLSKRHYEDCSEGCCWRRL